ncbi:Respiratory-chain NADH dehydrogenase 24 kDa subunit [Carpediemonas membranifera]|uniref:Respiratory-chain NADH dehydrogenase 24 kDa subunit n=1 Tax=Carpediemonas membranifera TaxID=201153 RepID=A0A8J6B339_9EUKA|nr:Respiratory-chain NADH dehydrogenase 24 kDa subunit [Carpediemonas membranifera]|eukprot:KAG9393259.1 Respiratory-chain NADH dehydrogenase 24 kDa subunit [Carpediemonas membranifera]
MSLSEVLAHYPNDQARAALIPMLHKIQERDGYISKDAMTALAEDLKLQVGQVESTATFYSMFRFEPDMKHSIDVCTGASCMIRGGDDVLKAVGDHIGKKCKGHHAVHSDDGNFSVREVECLGACSCGPVMAVDGEYYEDLSANDIPVLLQETADGRLRAPGSMRGRRLGEPV